MTSRGIVYALCTAGLWGVLPLFLRSALRHTEANEVAWLRFVIAFLILSLLVAAKRLITRRGPQPIESIPAPNNYIYAGAALCGVLLGFNYLGFMWGIKQVGPTQTQILIQTGPVMFTLGAAAFFKEKLTGRQWLGFVLVFLGLSLFGWVRGSESQSLILFSIGSLAVLVAAIAWALFALLQKKLLSSAISTPILNLIVYATAALVVSFSIDPKAIAPQSVYDYFEILFLGLNTLLAYGALSRAIAYIPAAWVSVIIACNPFLTFFLLWFAHQVLNINLDPHPLNAKTILPALVVFMGVIMVIFQKSREKIDAKITYN